MRSGSVALKSADRMADDKAVFFKQFLALIVGLARDVAGDSDHTVAKLYI